MPPLVVMWRAAGLEEPNAKGAKGAEGSADADAEMEADNFAAGGFFGWTGREQLGAGRVMARAFPTPTAAEARGPLRRLEGECPGTVASISRLDRWL